ncbi:sporulation histidine kinase inhibitor Sda [Bacillus sp. CHD6a]|nr:sporulation histidine kinase inhibitor Sda [Bacillus sp. CHD6a]KPB04808.1 Sporulation inhibitor A [Bacillus sp. CHD6a]
MDLLSNESLMEVYEAAITNDLNEEFLKLILDEMKRRKIDIPVANR